MSVPQRFNDREYINWLKCVNALILMKKILHPVIDTGVNELHESIKQKILSFFGGSNGAIQCNTCSAKKIFQKRATGQNPAKWMIHCPNNVCDVWLDEILAVHNEPDKRSINWMNSDITKWDTEPYEIAKVFMPKGLDKKTNLPEELDIQAVLSLLKYCTSFSKSIPNTQLLTDLIDLRNTIYHSGSFRVPDADRDKWIDMMSQLVIDLNLQGAIYTDLCMLKTETISINFQEIETRALMNNVTLLKCDIEAVKTEITCLQETQSQLSMKAQKIEDNTSDTSMKTETLEKDMKEVKRNLIELTQVSDKITIFLDNNDIKDKIVLTAAGCNEQNIIELRCRQYEMEKNILDIKYELSSIKEQVGIHKEETTHLLERMEIKAGKNEEDVKNFMREGRSNMSWAFLTWTSINFAIQFIYAVIYVYTCWIKLKPVLGDEVNWTIAAIIIFVILGIYCVCVSFSSHCSSISERKSLLYLLLGIGLKLGMVVILFLRKMMINKKYEGEDVQRHTLYWEHVDIFEKFEHLYAFQTLTFLMVVAVLFKQAI